MKKLNVNLYQGNPEELATKDNNNLFIDGDIEYNTGGGTIVRSITSVKNSDGVEIVSGGGGGGDFPYKYIIFDGSITISPDDWEYYPGDTKEDPYYEFKGKTILSNLDFNSPYCTIFGEGYPYLNDIQGDYSDGSIVFYDLDDLMFQILIDQNKGIYSLELGGPSITEGQYSEIFENSATLTVNMTIVNKS